MRIPSAPTIVGIAGVVAAIMLTTSPAFGGAWTFPSGNTDAFGSPLNFSYSNGGDVNGLFNDPFIFGDAFFFATDFATSAADGASNTQSDTVSVDLLANAGLKFGSIFVHAQGTYSIDTVGTVDVSANLSVTENTGLLRSFSDALTTDVAFPTSTPTGGLGEPFNGQALVSVEAVFPVFSDRIHLELSSDILVISGPGGSASVNIDFAALQVSLPFIMDPEPASASLFAVGFLALVRRRRR